MARTMTSPMPVFRTFSNKENSSSAFSTHPLLSPSFTSSIANSSARKPRIGGIGKAPKRSTHSTSKPYDRRTSVSRAKARATSPVKGEDRPAARQRKAAPSAIITSTPIPTTRPTPQIRIANIPIGLPRPRIPPVQSLPGEMKHIPIEWALPRLRAHFPALLAVSSQYRPQPQHSRPQGQGAPQQSFAFAIPALVAGGEMAEIEAKVKGREPDVCLAIKGKGKEDGPARLLPVNSLVYASQCSHWASSSSSSTSATSISSESGPSSLLAIQEESADEGEDVASDSDTTIRAAALSLSSSSSASSTHSSSSSTSSDSSDSPNSSSSSPHILHLPLLALTIPHPASFPSLHTHLHLPSRPLVPTLLALPPTCLSPADASTHLASLAMDDLMAKLEHMHGFWSNLCALGVSGDASWKGLAEAWGMVVEVIAARSRRV